MSGIARLKAAAECGAGISFNAYEVDELMAFITECDGVECTKHDAIVRSAVQRAQELEARLELWKNSEEGTLAQMAETNERFEGALRTIGELEAQVAVLKVQLSEEYRDWMKEQCNDECRIAEKCYNQTVTELRAKIAELEAGQESQCMVGGHAADCRGHIL